MIHRLQFEKFPRWNDEGSGLAELALVLPVFLLMFAAAVDFGRAYCLAVDLSGAAEAGALYGVQNPTDVAGMVTASQNDAPDLSGLSATASYGCECPDGSSAVASCSAPPTCTGSYVNYVQVTTTAAYTPIITFTGMPAAGSFQSMARMRVSSE
jgi:Flp pilus assembly protein TadG